MPTNHAKPVFHPLAPGRAWPAAFVLLACGLLLFFRNTAALRTMGLTFVAIVLEGLPFMLAGAVISGAVEVFLPRHLLLRLVPRRSWAAIGMGALLGLLLPVCECAIIPVARRLMRKGLPVGAGIAFLLGGPIVNPVVGFSTAVAYQFDWRMMLIRLLAGFAVAFSVGWLMELLQQKEPVFPATADQETDCACGVQAEHGEAAFSHKAVHALRHAALDMYDVGRFFMVGAFLAAGLQTFAARQGVVDFLSQSPVMNILVMMVLAFLLNLCSEADAFVAASFAGIVSVAGQMAFMVLGPMLDVKLLTTYMGVMRKKALGRMLGLVVATVLLAMILLDLVLR